MANWAHHGVTATSQATSTSTTVVQAVPWARGLAEGWVVAAGDGQHSVQPPQTFDAYCRYLCTDHSWLGQPEAELAAHLLPPSSRLFTLQGTQLTHIRRAGYRKHSPDRCIPKCAQELEELEELEGRVKLTTHVTEQSRLARSLTIDRSDPL